MGRQTKEEVRQVNLEACKRYRQTEAYKETQRRYRQSAKGKATRLANENNRRSIKDNGTYLIGDEWNDFVFQEIYELRDQRIKETGIEWHVDHILPFRGKNVSGLNVWNNLQLIPAIINLQKSNNVKPCAFGG